MPKAPFTQEYVDELRQHIDRRFAQNEIVQLDLRNYEPRLARWAVDYISGRFEAPHSANIRRGLEQGVRQHGRLNIDTAEFPKAGRGALAKTVEAVAGTGPTGPVGRAFRRLGRGIRRGALGRVPVLGELLAQQIEFTGSPLGLATLPIIPGRLATAVGVPAARTALGLAARPALRAGARAVGATVGRIPVSPEMRAFLTRQPATARLPLADVRQVAREMFVPRAGVPTQAAARIERGQQALRQADVDAIAQGLRIGAVPQAAKQFVDRVIHNPKLLRMGPRGAKVVESQIQRAVQRGTMTAQDAKAFRDVFKKMSGLEKEMMVPFVAPGWVRPGELALKEMRDLRTTRFSGRYIPDVYAAETLDTLPVKQAQRMRQPFGVSQQDLRFTAQRTNTSMEKLKDLARMEGRVAVGISREGRLVAKRSMQRDLAGMRSVFTRDAAEAQAKGWVPVGQQLPTGRISISKDIVRKWGPLAGGYMEPNTFREVSAMSDAFDKISKFMAVWKPMVTVLNPPVHFANIVSNLLILNAAGIPLWRADVYLRAAREMLKKRSPLLQEAQAAGAVSALPEVAGLQSFLRMAEKAGIENADNVASLAMDLNTRLATSGKSLVKHVGDVYQGEENWAKLAAYIFAKDRGQSATEAAAFANRWVFNYGDVTPTVRALRTSAVGVPFITYTVKVVPRMIEVASNRPDVFVRWKNLLDAWNIEAAGMIGMPMSELDKFVDAQAQLAGTRRYLEIPYSGAALSFFERIAPRMLLPLRDKKTGAPYFIQVARFSPVGQILNPRGAITLGPAPVALAEFISGRRQFGLEMGSRFAPEGFPMPGLMPGMAAGPEIRGFATRAARLGQAVGPGLLSAAGVPGMALLGSPMTQRLAHAALVAGADRGVPGARAMQEIAAPHTVQRISRTFVSPQRPGELIAGATLTGARRMDVGLIQRMLAQQVRQQRRALRDELRRRAVNMGTAQPAPDFGGGATGSTSAEGF